MSEIPKAYDPSQVEDRWYAAWLKQDAFRADPARAFNGARSSDAEKARHRAAGRREAYSIVIPPPNITGILHMGHVLNNTIQDLLARRKRMQGFEVLWLPGTDHAGIATQTVVERQLRKEERKTRHEIGREELLRRIWTWKDRHGDIILQQLKKLGCSCDWSRTVFTMDGLDLRAPVARINYSRWVAHVFTELHRQGLIYRGRRMVNWCVVARSALSDEEVIMKETRGHLWHLRYPLAESANGVPHLVVATTRPETMLGDTAVAVHPEDARYRALVGKKVKLPLTGREIPIVADAAVDPEFGTGCVKVTPAHDSTDFAIGGRHGMEQIQVIGFDGAMTAAAGEDYAGLDRDECREKVVADLQELGLIEKIEDYVHHVGYSERADVPVEPMVSDQWFLRYPAVKEALDQVLSRRIAFRPEHWIKVYEHWIANLQDWCLSRQLWWGHRIPVWTRPSQRGGNPEVYVGVTPPSGEGWDQDPDVLDTWFSSWLWPFATMVDAPENLAAARKDPCSTLAVFYPTSDLVTAPEILFLWVARMAMAGNAFMEDLPFHNVYFTGTVRDKQGRKMSKSLGNSPDPLDLIAKHGADALRFGLMRCAPLGLDVRFDEQQVVLGRNFCNKLWNAARLRLSQAAEGGAGPTLAGVSAADLASDDRAILMRTDQAVRDLGALYDSYEFNQIAARLYELFWTDYCDWYLEASKAALYGTDPARKRATLAVMDHVLHIILRLLHPYTPFITEELWHGLGFGGEGREGSIQFAPWPAPMAAGERARLGLDEDVLRFAELKRETVSAGRHLKAAYRIPSGKRVRYGLMPSADWPDDPRELAALQVLLGAEPLELVAQPLPKSAAAVTPLGKLFLPLEGLVDAAAEAKRLTTQIAKLEKELHGLKVRLADEGFRARAPAETVAAHEARGREIATSIAAIREQIATLGAS
ncbi:MAG: valine--tRNA ligase [Verrucomicrobiae bacterium]|nr:valine--tRNA ligase [Verrucomicrobiae bacterium]